MSGSTQSKLKNEPVVVAAYGKHEATLIFLHGLGDTGHGWSTSLAQIRPANMKIVCPTANSIPVTLNVGFTMPAWFDLTTLDPGGVEDEAGIKKSAGWINDIIAKEIAQGVDPKKIVIGGFSQGGALALFTGLTTKHKIGGLVALSTWLPLNKLMMRQADQINKDIPILQCHGDCDPLVPYKWGQMTSTFLKGVVASHEFKTYQGLAHSSNQQEMEDVKQFIHKIVRS